MTATSCILIGLLAATSPVLANEYPEHVFEVGALMLDADDFEDGSGAYIKYRYELSRKWDGVYLVGEIGTLEFDALDRDFVALGGEWHDRNEMRTSSKGGVPVTGVVGVLIGQETYAFASQENDDMYARAYYDAIFKASRYFSWRLGAQWDFREYGNRRNGGLRAGIDWRFGEAATLLIQASQDEAELSMRAALQWEF